MNRARVFTNGTSDSADSYLTTSNKNDFYLSLVFEIVNLTNGSIVHG
jgi:hypothetical protein